MVHLSTKSDYAIKALVRLALANGDGPVQARELQSGYASAWVSGLGVAPAAIPEASLVASNQQLLLLAPAGPLNSAGFAPIKAAQALQGGGGAAHAAQSARLFLYPATR